MSGLPSLHVNFQKYVGEKDVNWQTAITAQWHIKNPQNQLIIINQRKDIPDMKMWE